MKDTIPMKLGCYKCSGIAKLRVGKTRIGIIKSIPSLFYQCKCGAEFTTTETDTVTMESYKKI